MLLLKTQKCLMRLRGIGTEASKSSISQRDKALTEFAALCRRPKLVVDRVEDLVSGVSDVVEPRIRTMVVRDELGQPSVEAFVLPENNADSERRCWPTFITGKQTKSIAPSLFFQKTTLATAGRLKDAFDLMKEGFHVGWGGTPGIGKSMTVNSLLMRVLEDMKPGGWPQTLLLRMPPYLTAFTVADDNTVSATSFAKS